MYFKISRYILLYVVATISLLDAGSILSFIVVSISSKNTASRTSVP